MKSKVSIKCLSLYVFLGFSLPTFAAPTNNIRPLFKESGSPSVITTDRLILDDAIKTAAKEYKIVVVDFSAAWCGPCFNLKNSFEELKKNSPDAWADFASKAVYIELEETFLDRTMALDFLPIEPKGYPSIYMYNPATNVWSVSGASVPSILKNTEIMRSQGRLSSYYQQEMRQLVLSGKSLAIVEGLSTDEMITRFEFNSLPIMQTTEGLPVADIVAHLTWLSELKQKSPALVGNLDVSMESKELMLAQISTGSISLKDYIATYAPKMGYYVDTNPMVLLEAFSGELGAVVREKGVLAAADECSNRLENLKKDFGLKLVDLSTMTDKSSEQYKKSEQFNRQNSTSYDYFARTGATLCFHLDTIKKIHSENLAPKECAEATISFFNDLWKGKNMQTFERMAPVRVARSCNDLAFANQLLVEFYNLEIADREASIKSVKAKWFDYFEYLNALNESKAEPKEGQPTAEDAEEEMTSLRNSVNSMTFLKNNYANAMSVLSRTFIEGKKSHPYLFELTKAP